MNETFQTIVEKICDSDIRYKEDAYAFIMEALSFTQKKYKRQRHVSGKEMLDGVKDLVIKKYGPMAMTVLEYWGINSTEDIGNVIFNLVENRILSKTEEDSIEEFRNRYDFEEVFKRGYKKQLVKKISRMRL